jgi:phosphoglucosamine mutase
MDLKGMRIAMDLSNGAMTSMEAWVLENIPAEWVVIGNSAGPINAGCGSENLSALSRTVCESGCIGGFAVDGDGDRCRLVDGGGAEVDGDALAWIFCRHMKLKSLAVTVMSNTALEDTLQGVRIVRTEVGDTYLRAAMDDHSLELGSEQSGHVLFDDFEAGDGLLTGIRAWSSICRSGGDLGAILSDYSPNPRKIYGIEVGAHRPDIAELNEVLEQLWGSPSPLGPGGRVFLRYSGTEPVLRVLVEGRDAHVVDEISKTAYATLTGVLECS